MTTFESKNPEFAKDFIERVKQQKPLGGGIEKKVYPHPEDPKKVVAVFHPEGTIHTDDPMGGSLNPPIVHSHPEMNQEERNRYKRQYYLIKILRLLFPKNIPDIHNVVADPRLMIREKVDVEPSGEKLNDWKEEIAAEKKKRTAIEPLIKELKALGLPVQENASNFIRNPEGDYQYIETFLLEDYGGRRVTFEEEKDIANKLDGAIKKKQLAANKEDLALGYLERYRMLCGDGGLEKNEAKDRREKRIEALLKKRFETALGAFKLEERLLVDAEKVQSQQEAEELAEQLSKEVFAHLPEDLREGYADYIENYINSVLKAKRVESELKKEYKHRGGEEEEAFESYVFKKIAGKKPASVGRFSREGGYFLMIPSEEDFNSLRKGNIGGAYHPYIFLGVFKNIPHVMIMYPRFSSGALLHERQHYKNHAIFNHFSKPNEKDWKTARQTAKARMLKDEILASMIHMPFDEFIDSVAINPIYRHLFTSKGKPLFDRVITFFFEKEFNEKQTAEMFSLVHEISDLFYEIKPFLKTPAQRIIFVNQLIDIPLENFPKWLKELKRFYQNNAGELDQKIAT